MILYVDVMNAGLPSKPRGIVLGVDMLRPRKTNQPPGPPEEGAEGPPMLAPEILIYYNSVYIIILPLCHK